MLTVIPSAFDLVWNDDPGRRVRLQVLVRALACGADGPSGVAIDIKLTYIPAEKQLRLTISTDNRTEPN